MRRELRLSLIWLAVFAFGSVSLLQARADDKNSSHVDFVVVKSANGKPVRNASVILHPVDKDGKQSNGGMELKTDPEGKCSLDAVPYGKIRVQAIAQGYQTYGDDITIDQPTQEITIKLNRPQKQYSIYK